MTTRFEVDTNDYLGFKYEEYLMRLGKDRGGTRPIVVSGGIEYAPGYPQQEISKIAWKAARTLDSLLDEVINLILPADFKNLATSRLK